VELENNVMPKEPLYNYNKVLVVLLFKNKNYKTFFALSMITIALISGGIISVHAVTDDGAFQDTTPPVLYVPVDITVKATGITTVITIGEASVTDDVDSNPAIINDAPNTFPIGNTVVTWTATDASGNIVNAIQIITIQDTTPSTVTTHIIPNHIDTEAITDDLVGGIVGIFEEERPFITTWSISELDKSLEIPTTGTGYDYIIDWGDGTIDISQTSNSIHTYVNAGTIVT